VSVLNAFLSTWSNARQTYGEGTPQTGAQYDGSSTLNQLQSTVQTAAPGSKWTGGAANAYGAANTEHGRVLGQLAGLDQRLSAHVDQSAEVVAAGRRDLDAVRKWVVDAAASVPQNAAGERMQMAIVQKGISQVQEIIQRSNGDLSAIGGKIRGLGDEYQALGNQKFAPKEGPDFVDGKKDDEDAEEKRRQAEKDVHDALAGNQDAAKRVESVLNEIKPGRQLTPEQGSHLSQMQAQQNGMSIDALKTAEQRLGDQKHIIGDSWQLMSNPNVNFPKTDTKMGALDDPNQVVKGGFDKLPQSVQQALKSPGVLYADQMRDISGIVRDGNPALQTGTQLDSEMLNKADRMMDAPIWEHDPASNGQDVGRDPFLDPVVSEIFTSAGRDHPAVAALITGGQGEDFLHDITHHYWADKGAAAGSLLSWTGPESVGPNAAIAADTAEAYANYIGRHDSELLALNNHTLGDINPNLVQGMSAGLTPYIPNIAGMSEGQLPGFDTLDSPDALEKGLMPVAKGVFSVISSDDKASVLFNGAAQHQSVLAQERFAENFRNHVPNLSPESRDLFESATLQGLVDTGLHNALSHEKLNGIELEKSVYQAKSQAFDMDKSILGGLGGNLPVVGDVVGQGVDVFGQAAKDAIIGPAPTVAATDANGNYIAPDLATSAANAQVIGALVNEGVQVPGINPEWIVHDANGDARIMSFGEAQQADKHLSYGQYNQALAQAAEAAMGQGFADDVNDTITYRYNQVSEVLDPQTDQPRPPK
jgi:EspA/EspE family